MKFVPLEEADQGQPSFKFVPLEAEAPTPKPAPAPKKAAPVEGSYGAMGEGIDDTVPAPAPKTKPAALAPQIDPTTGKPYPEAASLPEPSVWDRAIMWGGENKAKAANEYAARRTAAERGITINEAYKITPDANRPLFNPEGRALGKAAVEAGTTVAKSLTGRTSPLAKGYESGEINPITGLPEEALYDLPVGMANTALRAVRKGDIPVKDRTWLDKAITLTTVPPQETDLNTQAFANVGQSLGYSATTMVASAISGAIGTATTGPVGGVVAGLGTSGAVSYGASKDEFLSRLKEKLDKNSKNTFERSLNETEWESAKKEFDAAATKYGAWEAVPEALSNLIFLKVFLAPVKTARTLDKVIEYTKRAAISQPPEHITETITALGQNKAELEAKLTKEELNVKDAFKQQFIQTLVIGSGMAAGAATAQQVNKFYETYVEPKVRPGSALAKAIQADLTDYMNQPARQQTPMAATNVRPSNVQPPEAVDTLNAAPPADPREQVLTQAYAQEGIPPEQAAQVAQQSVAALNTPPAQPTTEAAVRTALQMEGTDVPSTEPPSYVTEPSTGEQGIGLPSEPREGTTGRPTSPIERGLDAARNLIGSAIGREEEQRPPVDAHYQSTANVLAKAFRLQALPNLAPVFGVGWQQQTMASNPTPEQFEEAAYNRLEELRFLGQRVEGTPVKAKPAAPKVEAAKPVESIKEKIFNVQRTQPEAKPGDAITLNLPHVPGGYKVSGIVGDSVYMDKEGRELTDRGNYTADYIDEEGYPTDKENAVAQRHVFVTYKVDGQQINNYFDADTLRLNTLGFEEKPDLTKPKEEPRVTEAPKAEQTKEERPKAPAAKPAAPAVEEDRTESLQLLAGRNEALEVEQEEKALLGINDHLKKWFGTTADGLLRRRAKGAGPKKKPDTAKTDEERQEQLEDINKLNRDAETLIKATDKYTPIPESEQDGSVEQRERGRTGQYPTAAEYDFAEALRLHRLDLMRMALHGLALRSKSRPIKGYSAAAEYLRKLKPAERARAKALWERTVQPTALPVKPKATLTPAQLERFRAGEKLSKRGRPAKEKTEAPAKTKKAKEAKALAEAREINWKTETPFETSIITTEEDYNAFINPPREDTGSKASLMQLFARMRDEGSITKEDFEALTEQQELTPKQEEELFLQQIDEREEVPPSEAQENLEDRTIHDELDADEKKVIAKHYGQSSYNEVAQKKFTADVILALNEGLDAVSRVLHDIIKRLQASVLAGIMVMNTSFMTPPMQVAVPTTETRTVQVLAEVPTEAKGMSKAGELAFKNIFPAIQAELKRENKLFVLTDKPSATVFVFNPDGSLLVQSKVLLGKTLGDYYVGKTDIDVNKITPAGLFTLGLRDAARGITERGGDERKTASHYDFGKVFVLDKAIEGKASVTLFHSVWTHEKDAPKRLAALKKAGPEDSRYSFGCINLDKNVYGDLIANHQDQMDGAKMFVVPDEQAATMDFIRGKAITKGDIVRQSTPEITKTITERVPPATPRAEERMAPAILREEKVAFGRRKLSDVENSRLAKEELDKLAKGKDNLIDDIINDKLNPEDVKKMKLSDLMELTQLAAELASTRHTTDTDGTFQYLSTLPAALAYIVHTGTPLDAGIAEALLTGENLSLAKKVGIITLEPNTKHPKDSVLSTFQRELHEAGGVFAPNPKRTKGYIALAGILYDKTGLNTATVLHEGVHAVTSAKIDYVEGMIKAGRQDEVDPKLLEAYNELKDLMGRAAAIAEASLDPVITHLEAASAFDDLHEFVAYGLTDPTMKSLLFATPGAAKQTSGFTRFVNALMKLLGVSPKFATGMKDFVLATGKLMQAKAPSNKKMAEVVQLKDNINTEIKRMAKRQAKSTAAAERDLKASQSPSAIIGHVGIVQSTARKIGPVGTFIENNFTSMKIGTLQGLLNVAPTSTLYKIGIANGVTRLDETKQLIRNRGAMRMGIQKEMEAIVERWRKLSSKQLDLLADTMHLSTDLQEDPSLPVQYSGRIGVRSPELRNMWRQLAQVPDGHQLYKDVRDFYKKAAATFIANLKQQVATSALSGNVNDPLTPKGKAFKEIQDTYEESIGAGPFFPLMRHGDNWVRFGKKANVNFQLAESPNEAKQFINAQLKERKRLGDSRNMEELRAVGEADFGYDVKILQDKLAKESTGLRKIFKAIDAAATGTGVAVDDLKKDVFKMHLLLLPEQSFRKMFMPRKNRAGYNRDALRNFVNASGRLANQLAGSRYNRRINESLTAAMNSLQGMEGKEKYELLTNEIKSRLELVLNPQYEVSGFDEAVRFANKFTFMYLLTDLRQAANNVWSLPSKGVPTLVKYFGETATFKEMTLFMYEAVKLQQLGVTKTNPNGSVSWRAPSLTLSPLVKNSRELTRAAQLLELREVSGHGTMTTDVYLSSKAQATSLAGRILDTTVRVSGSLHQGSERIIREVLFFTAYNLARKQGLSLPRAVDKAQDVVEEALFRYTPDETPPWLNKPTARLMFQFKKFSGFTTNYYVVNALETVGKLPSDVRAGAAKAIIGSYMMAILGAGIGGAFGVSLMIYMFGVVDGAWDKYADEKLKKSFKNMSPLRWFKTEYLVEQFGDAKIPGTDKTLAGLLADGLLDTLSGSKISSGISEGSLWFDEPPTSLDVDAWMNYAGKLSDINLFGPFGGVVEKFISGVADWTRGDTRKAIEKWTPVKFLRNIEVAERLRVEGYKDRDFDTVMRTSDFKDGQLFMQALGFKPQAMAELEDINYFLASNEKKITQQRTGLIDRWVQNAKRNDFAAVTQANKAITNFNRTYPYEKLIIEPDQLVNALDSKLESSLGKVRGRQVLDKPEFDWLEKYRASAKLKVLENAP